MSRTTFLTIAATVALCVGAAAIVFPAQLLASKGTVPSEAANVWMREVGVLLIGIGVVVACVRRQPDSPAMRALMLGNFIVQIGLLATELSAYSAGVITKISGVAPNFALHVLLAFGFAYFWGTNRSAKTAL
jgi:hypothetical protein